MKTRCPTSSKKISFKPSDSDFSIPFENQCENHTLWQMDLVTKIFLLIKFWSLFRLFSEKFWRALGPKPQVDSLLEIFLSHHEH